MQTRIVYGPVGAFVKYYLSVMFLIPLLELFDIAFERYASRHYRYGPIPYRWFDFGYLEEERKPPVKFWHLRLPSYAWAEFDFAQRYGWGQRVIWWTSTGGVHVDLWEIDR